MTRYIAYKTAQNSPDFPNGFITEHFETDKEILEGYTVVSLETFNAIFQNNVTLVRKAERERGTVMTVGPETPQPVLRPASDIEHVPTDFVPPAPANVNTSNAELFNQFLAWVAAGKPGTPPSNT